MHDLRIGYFADGPWSHNALLKLLEEQYIKVLFICSRFDNQDEILGQLANEYSIPFLNHQNINSEEFISLIKKFDCNLFVSMSFNQIFKKEILEIPFFKTINCHAGKLPFYRGRNILNWVLINDEKEFGITAHYVDEGIDTGDIILQKTFPISDMDDYNSLLQISHDKCAEVLVDSLKIIQNDNVISIKQNEIHPLGFYCSKRVDGDEIINWNQESRDIFNFVRAVCYPGPGAKTFLKGEPFIIQKVSLIQNTPKFKGVPGSIIGILKDGIYVKTLDSFIKVVSNEGKVSPRLGDRFD